MLHGQVLVDLIVSSINLKASWDKDIIYLYTVTISLGFPDSSVGKESTCNAGDPSLIPGSGRCPGEGTGYPLQYSGLENSMDCIVHGVTKSQTWLSLSLFTILYLLYLSLCLAYNNSNNLAVMIITKLQWTLYSFWTRHSLKCFAYTRSFDAHSNPLRERRVEKIPWSRKQQSTPAFLPGQFPWTVKPGRLQSMGLQRSDVTGPTVHTETQRSLLTCPRSSRK